MTGLDCPLPMRRAAVGIALALAGAPAAANVFEISDDGSVHTRTGSAVVAWTGDAASDDPAAAGTSEPAPDLPAAALTAPAAPTMPASFAPALLAAAARYDLSPSLLAALVARESAWQPNARSAKGAIGLAQLMPATARALAVDPRDPAANLDGAARYLRRMLDLFDGDVEKALAAYNAGPARVLRANGVPAIPETRAYVSTIIDRLNWPVPAIILTGARP